MSFNFGAAPTNPPASGFTLPTNPTTTASALGFQLGIGSGDNKLQTGGTQTFKAPTQVSASPSGFAPPQAKTSATAFGISTQTSTAPTLTLGTTGLLPAAASTAPQLSFGASKPASTTAPSLFGSLTATSGATTTTAVTGLSFSAPSTAAPAAKLSFVAPSTTSTISTSLPASTTSTALAPTSVTSAVSAIPATGSLTFAQLEDSINKWTVDLEEQGKFFVNQAKQLNAWDSLLIANGEKILGLNGSIERVKQQQLQLDQELDFVLAQQKELEELIAPLEKELLEVPASDIDRNQMYQFSEVIDSQLKQMSDDLKEIIEHINESNKDEETTNPVTQISRILNAHMNSLQWIDRNTAQISSHLEQISKIQDSNRRNVSFNNSMTM